MNSFPKHRETYEPVTSDPLWGVPELRRGLLGMAISFGSALSALLAAKMIVDGQSVPILVSAFVFQLGLLLTVALVLRGIPQVLNSLLGPVQLGIRTKFRWAGFAFACVLLTNVAYQMLAGTISRDLVPPSLPPEFIAPNLRWVGFTVVVLVGPFAEEIFFRGFLFRGLIARFGLWMACIMSAALFSLAHADIALLVPAFVSGLILAFVFWRSGSLWPPILAHTTQNAVAFGLVM